MPEIQTAYLGIQFLVFAGVSWVNGLIVFKVTFKVYDLLIGGVVVHLLETRSRLVKLQWLISGTSLTPAGASRGRSGGGRLVHATAFLLSVEGVGRTALLGRKGDLLQVIRRRVMVVHLTFLGMGWPAKPVKIIATEHLLR